MMRTPVLGVCGAWIKASSWTPLVQLTSFCSKTAAPQGESTHAEDGVSFLIQGDRFHFDAAQLSAARKSLALELPDEDHIELHDLDETKRLLFAHFNSTESLMDLFERHVTPEEPLYDLAGWLERNFPDHGWRARGSFYHWRAWMAENLPEHEAAVYLAFDEHMQYDPARSSVLKNAEWELNRLMHWRGQRLAAGLPPDLDPAERRSRASTREGAGPGSELGPDKEEAAGLEEEEGSDSGRMTIEGARAAAAKFIPKPENLEGMSLMAVLSKWGGLAPAKAPLPRRPPPSAEAAAGADGADGAPVELSEEEKERLELRNVSSLPHSVLLKHFRNAERRLRAGELLRRGGKRRTFVSTDGDHYPDLLSPEHFPKGEDEHDNTIEGDEDPLEDSSADNKLWPKLVAPGSKQHRHALDSRQPPGRPVRYAQVEEQASSAKTWHDMALLDRSVLEQQERARKKKARRLAASKKTRKFRITNDGYVFDLSARPPTRHLSLLLDYLTLKYADVLMKREAAGAVLATVQPATPYADLVPALGPEAGPGAGTRVGAWGPHTLSPAQRKDINEKADRLFEDDPQGYSKYMRELFEAGLLPGAELLRCQRAAQRRLRHLADQRTAAALNKGPVSAAERHELWEVLAGRRSASLSTSSSADARALWRAAAATVAAEWVPGVKQQLRSAGADVDDTWWDQQISFEEAKEAWEQYMELSGGGGSLSFEDVLIALQAGARGDKKTLQQLSELWERFCSETGYAAGPAPDIEKFDDPWHLDQLFPSSSLKDVLTQHWQAVSQQHLGITTGWDGPPWEVTYNLLFDVFQRLRAGPGTSPGASVSAQEPDAATEDSSFPPGSPLANMLRLEDAEPDLAGDSEPMWPLAGESGTVLGSSDSLELELGGDSFDRGMLRGDVLESSESPDLELGAAEPHGSDLGAAESLKLELGVHESPDSELGALERGESVKDAQHARATVTVTASPSGASAPASALRRSRAPMAPAEAQPQAGWQGYLDQSTDQHQAYVSAYGLEDAYTPPYPGATKLLRFDQSYVLHAMAATTDHPLNHPVTLHVNAQQLAAEVGLSAEALALVQEVCGQRYDPSTGDIVLKCRRYPRREENRKWCVEVLFKLMHEGQARHPSPNFLFLRMPNPFVPSPTFPPSSRATLALEGGGHK